MAGRAGDGAGAGGGGAPAQDRELRARGRRTMAKLLEAGRRVFVRRGYHAARVDDIVRAARTSHGTFYLYFADKQDLLAALTRECREAMGALAGGLGPVTPDEAGLEVLSEFVGDFLAAYERYGPVLRAWSEAAPKAPGSRSRGEHAFDEIEAVLAERIRAAGPDAAGGVEPQRAATALVAMLERVGAFVAVEGEATKRGPMTAPLARIVHRGFFAAKGVNQSRGAGV